jgi:CRP/FNR family transcriptional regulator, nitrogen fixation regulation protein
LEIHCLVRRNPEKRLENWRPYKKTPPLRTKGKNSATKNQRVLFVMRRAQMHVWGRPPARAWCSVPGETIELLRQPFANHLARRLIPSAETETFNLLIDRIGVRVSFAPKTRIFHESDPAESVYKVVGGSVYTCKTLRDGRRQISGLYLPGDFFGFECADEHSLSAEAVSNTKVLVIKKSALAAASRDAAIKRQVLLLMARELARLQERTFLLIKNAQERICEFILDMEKRAAVGNYIDLPMKRQDIADYLGLTIETVSRTLTLLENRGAIEILPRKGIVVRDHSLLKTMMADRNKMVSLTKINERKPRRSSAKKYARPALGRPRSTAEQLNCNRRSGRVLTKEEVSRERERGKGERPEVARSF